MKLMTAAGHIPGVSVEGDEEAAVYAVEGIGAQEDIGDTALLADHSLWGGNLEPSQLVDLLPEQRRTYDIIDMHLQHYLSGETYYNSGCSGWCR